MDQDEESEPLASEIQYYLAKVKGLTCTYVHMIIMTLPDCGQKRSGWVADDLLCARAWCVKSLVLLPMVVHEKLQDLHKMAAQLRQASRDEKEDSSRETCL